LNPLAQLLAVIGALIAAIYPFLKRWTHLPQAGLGLAFSWGIPMAFAAVTGEVGGIGWLLFAASWAWIVGYDTIYAMVDRDDDVRIGIKSTAVLLGRADRAVVGVLQVAFLAVLIAVGRALEIGAAYYAGLALAAALFVRQQMLIRRRERSACMAAFGSNVWVGFALFAGTVAAYLAPR
jgi:4-hydroxybenzoate polyprenyltransferase